MSDTPYLDAWIEKQAQDKLPAIIPKKISKPAPPKAKKVIPKTKPKAKKPLFDFDKGDVFGSGKE